MNTTTTDTSHFNSPVALERRERIHSAAEDIAKAHASHGTMKAAIHAVDSEHTTISYTELALLWQGVNAHYNLMRETATTAPALQAEPATTANATQIGGNHYASKAVQPWDAMQAWLSREAFEGFLLGSAVAYLARVNTEGVNGKGGLLDVQKARHCCDKLIEVLEQK